MFIGHFALGLASEKISSRASLGTYFLAVQFLDLLWPFFLLAGIEKVEIDPGNTVITPLNFVYYPYSHGLLMAMIWAVLFGTIYLIIRKDRKTAVVLGLLVFSHWVLDYLTHRPDLPLAPWNDLKFGLGLWNHKIASIVTELLMFVAGSYLYIHSTSAKNKVGQFALWGFLLFMIAIYFVNLFGPPPDSPHTLAIVAFAQWILVAWGYWIDHNRTSNVEN